MGLTKIDDRGLKTPIDLLDNEKIRLGTGSDLEIFHDGSNSILNDSGTGLLQFQSGGSTKAAIVGDGVQLYEHLYIQDNDKIKIGDGDDLQIHHTSNKNYINAQNYNLAIQRGGTTCLEFDGNGDLNIPDSKILGLGSGADLQLYHNGSDSYVKNTGGDLYIRDTNGNIFIQPKTDENAIKCIADGAVQIFHNNVKTCQTEAGGVWQVRGPTDGNATLMLTANDGGDNGDSWRWLAEGETNTKKITLTNNPDGNWETSLTATGNAGVELYHNNVKKLSTTANGICFNSDTAAGNALNDYEEGDWTPNDLSGSTYNVASGAVGKYVKIGACVHAWAQFGTDTTGAVSTGDRILVGDLPFNANGISNPAALLTINYTASTYSTAKGNVNSSNELGFTVTQTTGHNRNGSGYYIQVTYWTDS